MCGIAGGKNQEMIEKITGHLEHRGKSTNITEKKGFYLGHVLHPIVGNLEQPISKEGRLTANCEIYNWKELNDKNNWNTENDAETLARLMDSKGKKALEELDGIYAFAYQNKNEIILCRDILGVNPIWYSEDPFVFASEKQALEKEGLTARELHPRQILKYDIQKEQISKQKRNFFSLNTSDNQDLEDQARKIKNLFLDAVEKRIPDCEIGLLFSGGLDSTMIAAALKELEIDFTAYTAGIQHGNVNKPRDLEWAENVADQMDLNLESYEATLEEVESDIPKIVEWISSTSVVKTGVSLPFHYSLKNIDQEKAVFTGLGSEQLYAGYHRQQGYLNKECLSGLRGMFERDLYRDNVIGFRHSTEIRIPFLDHDLICHALSIQEDYKVKEGYRKFILRKAAEMLGVPEKVVWREKTAAQYGSNFDKAISRLAKDKDFEHKQKYLNSLRDKPNNRLSALTSGGKDSNSAIYRMLRRNNEFSCLITLRSENKHSYMFDSEKNLTDIEWQSKKLEVPLITQKTKGQKENELEDLENIMSKAREEYEVEGIVTGAIASTYQRDRVEKIAEKVGLKVFAPLWREDQSNYMRWLVSEGFEIEITSVSARGLDEDWEGKILDEENLEELLDRSEKYEFNPAGEGGEYETRIVGFPAEIN